MLNKAKYVGYKLYGKKIFQGFFANTYFKPFNGIPIARYFNPLRVSYTLPETPDTSFSKEIF
jgi:hypothetical protein